MCPGPEPPPSTIGECGELGVPVPELGAAAEAPLPLVLALLPPPGV